MIDRFSGRNEFLSNFYLSPFQVGGVSYLSVEHAYQAAKSLDKSTRDKIRIAQTPGKAKRLGQKVEIRQDWEEIKIKVMKSYLVAKFEQNPPLRKLLFKTGDVYLEEGNDWHDNFWGKCHCPNCAGVINAQNWLGFLLMEVRHELICSHSYI